MTSGERGNGVTPSPPAPCRTVLVTGAVGGIGSAVVDRLVASGSRVVGIDLNQPDPSRHYPPESWHFVQGDVCDEGAIDAAFDIALRNGGAASGLVTCAFDERRARLDDLMVDDFATAYRVVTGAAWQWSSRLVRELKGEAGAIVHVASVHAIRSAPGFATYAAAKAGLVSLTRSGALEWGPLGVRSNAVLPGFVCVPRNRAVWQDQDRAAKIASRTPIRRLLVPDDVAGVVEFLLSEQAGGINGVALPVDGGVLARLGLGDQ